MPRKSSEGTSAYVLVDLNWTVGLRGFGSYGPGKDIRVPRTFAEKLDLTIKADASDDPTKPVVTQVQQPRARTQGKGQEPAGGAAGGGEDFDPTTMPKGWEKGGQTDLARYNATALQAEYERLVEAGDIQPMEKGSGANGAMLKDDYVQALNGYATATD